MIDVITRPKPILIHRETTDNIGKDWTKISALPIIVISPMAQVPLFYL
jgi:hypothetical protein